MLSIFKGFFTDGLVFRRIVRGFFAAGSAIGATLAHQLPAPWDSRVAIATAICAALAGMIAMGDMTPSNLKELSKSLPPDSPI